MLLLVLLPLLQLLLVVVLLGLVVGAAHRCGVPFLVGALLVPALAVSGAEADASHFVADVADRAAV